MADMEIEKSSKYSRWHFVDARILGFVAFVLYILIYIVPLEARPLFVPDEARYGEISREMVDKGDWLKLRLAGLPYYEKPPLGYWLNALSISALGRTAFAVRLPSALSAGLSALAVFLLVLGVRKSAKRATVAAIVYLSCVQVFGMGTFAVLDSMFSFFVCLSMVLFFASGEQRGKRKQLLCALAGIACGAAFLTKGFTAIVIPALTIALCLLWERRFKEMAYVWILPTAVAGAFVLPFALAIHRANPDFWNYFFWVEHLQRFLNPDGGQHGQPFWLFLPVLAVGAIPWIFFIFPVFSTARRLAATSNLTRYCICWLIGPFLFFSACGGKLPTYILPCFPPIAIMIADAFFEAKAISLKRSAMVSAVLLVVAVAVFFCWLPLSDEDILMNHLFDDVYTIPLSASILLGGICLYLAGKRFAYSGGRLRAAGLVGFSLCGMCVASFLFMPPAVENQRSPSRLLDEVVSLTPKNAFIVADQVTLAPACWAYERSDILFFADPGEFAYGIARLKTTERYVPTAEEAAALIAREMENGRPAAAIIRASMYPALENAMQNVKPQSVRKLSRFVWVLYSNNNE